VRAAGCARLDRDRQELLADALLRRLPGAGSTAALLDEGHRRCPGQRPDTCAKLRYFFTLWVGLWHVNSRPKQLPATRSWALYAPPWISCFPAGHVRKIPTPGSHRRHRCRIRLEKLRPVLEVLACETLTQQGEDFALSKLLDLLDQAKDNSAVDFPREMRIDASGRLPRTACWHSGRPAQAPLSLHPPLPFESIWLRVS
jgi:hypothetical protein